MITLTMRLFWLIALGLLPAVGRAQVSAPLAQSLLWRIDADTLPTPSYLFGTLHLLCPTQLEVSKPLRRCLARSEQLALELDFDDPALGEQVKQAMYYPDSVALSDLLDTTGYALVTRFFADSLGTPIALFGPMRPTFLSALLVPHLLGCAPVSWEARLTVLAADEDIEVVGLETVAEQMAVLDALPLRAQAAALAESVRDYAATQEAFRALANRYAAQDPDGLFALLQESSEQMADLEPALLTARNRRWVGRMAVMMHDRPTFFAVGAGHLGGPEGLVRLLRRAGYRLSPVLPEATDLLPDEP